MQWLGDLTNREPTQLQQISGYADELRKEKREERMKSEEAKSRVALEQVKQVDKTRQYLQTAYQNYWNKDEQQRALFEQSDSGKEFKKVMKKYLPELIGEDGELIPMPSKPQTAGGYKPQTQEEALQYREKIEGIKNKVDANAPLTASEAMRLMEAANSMYNSRSINKSQANFMTNYAKQYLPNYKEPAAAPKEPGMFTKILGMVQGKPKGTNVTSLLDEIKAGSK